MPQFLFANLCQWSKLSVSKAFCHHGHSCWLLWNSAELATFSQKLRGHYPTANWTQWSILSNEQLFMPIFSIIANLCQSLSITPITQYFTCYTSYAHFINYASFTNFASYAIYAKLHWIRQLCRWHNGRNWWNWLKWGKWHNWWNVHRWQNRRNWQNWCNWRNWQNDVSI